MYTREIRNGMGRIGVKLEKDERRERERRGFEIEREKWNGGGRWAKRVCGRERRYGG